jgi:hypothetical protein
MKMDEGFKSRKDEIREYGKKHYQDNKERIKEYNRLYPHKKQKIHYIDGNSKNRELANMRLIEEDDNGKV